MSSSDAATSNSHYPSVFDRHILTHTEYGRSTMIHVFEPTYNELKNFPIGHWVRVMTGRGIDYLNICGKDCMISLEMEPTNTNRGTVHAKLEVFNSSHLNIEPRDGWDYGRYYFDLDRAKAEVEAWLKAWNQIEEEGDRHD